MDLDLEPTQLQISQFPANYSKTAIQKFIKPHKRLKYPENFISFKKKIFIKVFKYNDNRTPIADAIVFDENLDLGEKMENIQIQRDAMMDYYNQRVLYYNARLREQTSGSTEYTTIEAIKIKLFGNMKDHNVSLNFASDLALYDQTSNATDTDKSSENSDIDVLDYLNQVDLYMNEYDPSAEFLARQIYENLERN